MKVVTATAGTAEAKRPIRMSRRVGVYRQKSAMLGTRVSEAPHITVTYVAKPTQVYCCSGEWKTWLGA